MLKAPNKEKNFFTLIKMISAMETREDDEDYKNHVDQMFDELEKEDPNHFAVRQYRKFKLAAGVTLYIRHLTYVIIKGMIKSRKETVTYEKSYHYCLV